jgi:hypothetical protein
MVARRSNDYSPEPRPFHTLISSSDFDLCGIAFGVDSQGNVSAISRDSTMIKQWVILSLNAGTDWQVFAFRSEGAIGGNMKVYAWMSGPRRATITVEGATGFPNMNVGAFYNKHRGWSEFAWSGLMAEVAIYSKALSDIEVDAVQRHLARKFGLMLGP